MFYDFSITIPANTPEASPVEERALLDHGVISHVEVEFPPGCAGLVRTYIRHSLHQLWPSNPEGYFWTDGRAIVWNDYYELFAEPYDLIIGGYNLDDFYPHEITFRFEVLPREVAERGKMIDTWIGKVRRLLGVK